MSSARSCWRGSPDRRPGPPAGAQAARSVESSGWRRERSAQALHTSSGTRPACMSRPKTRHPRQSREPGLEEGRCGEHPGHRPCRRREPEPVPEHHCGRRERNADGLGESLRWPRHQSRGSGQTRCDDPGGQLTERAQGRSGEDPCPEAVAERHEQPSLARCDRRDAEHEDAGSDGARPRIRSPDWGTRHSPALEEPFRRLELASVSP